MVYDADDIRSRIGTNGRGIRLDEVVFLISESRSGGRKFSEESIEGIGDKNPTRRFATEWAPTRRYELTPEEVKAQQDQEIQRDKWKTDFLEALDKHLEDNMRRQIKFLRKRDWTFDEIQAFLVGIDEKRKQRFDSAVDCEDCDESDQYPDEGYDLYERIRTMYKFGKKKEVWY